MTHRPAAAAAAAAAALALRWHPRTAAMVAGVTCLTLIGTLPALALLGARTAPQLTMAMPDLAVLRATWGGGAPWPLLERVTLAQLQGLAFGSTLLVLAVGIATLLALHAARAGARHGEVVVARAVGATRRTMLLAGLLEATALAVVACAVALVVVLLAGTALRAAWPGTIAAGLPWPAVAGALAVAATCLAAPLLLVRAVTAARLIDADRRPLTVAVPALQLAAALIVLAGGRTLARALAPTAQPTVPALHVATVEDPGDDRLARAERWAVAIERAHAAGRRLSLSSPGTLLGLGTTGDVVADCGACALSGFAARYLTAPAVQHVVAGDTFALLGRPIVAGRALDARDRWDAPLAAVVSARMAREQFEGGHAVGRRLRLATLGDRWFTVVGVVADEPPRAVAGALQPAFGVWVSALQLPMARIDVASDTPLPDDRLAALGRIARRDRLPARAAALRAPAAWYARLLAGQGVVALALALGGLVVLLRLRLDAMARDLGIRIAVGAGAWAVRRLVLGVALRIAVAGVAIGAWGGLIAWDVLPRILPGAPAWDPRVVAETGALLGGLVLAVAWWAAARTLRTPPVVLLQADAD